MGQRAGRRTAAVRITGTTTANVFGNVNPPDCTIVDSSNPSEIYAVSCSGWCVASGQPCNTLDTPCCRRACSGV